MVDHINLNEILFLDIETAPVVYKFQDLSERGKSLWEKKMKWQMERDGVSVEESYDKAGILAEFARVVCVSVGFYFSEDEELRVKSFNNRDEKELLKDLAKLFATFLDEEDKYLCAHNGKEFDFPFLARRYLINGLQLPYCLDLAGKKPWEVQHLDTMNLWKFGDYKHYTSLDLLTHTFNIPSPKSDMDGSDVARLFYEDKADDRIKKYCEDDIGF